MSISLIRKYFNYLRAQAKEYLIISKETSGTQHTGLKYESFMQHFIVHHQNLIFCKNCIQFSLRRVQDFVLVHILTNLVPLLVFSSH